jgi:hypothetical protein
MRGRRCDDLPAWRADHRATEEMSCRYFPSTRTWARRGVGRRSCCARPGTAMLGRSRGSRCVGTADACRGATGPRARTGPAKLGGAGARDRGPQRLDSRDGRVVSALQRQPPDRRGGPDAAREACACGVRVSGRGRPGRRCPRRSRASPRPRRRHPRRSREWLDRAAPGVRLALSPRPGAKTSRSSARCWIGARRCDQRRWSRRCTPRAAPGAWNY